MEIILCAAIKIIDKKDVRGNDLIYCGYRHHNIFWLGSEDTVKFDTVQGFLTSKGRFVDRLEAVEIAVNANQVQREKLIAPPNLYSEDLYTIKDGVNYKIQQESENQQEFYKKVLLDIHLCSWTGNNETLKQILDCIGNWGYLNSNSSEGEDLSKSDIFEYFKKSYENVEWKSVKERAEAEKLARDKNDS